MISTSSEAEARISYQELYQRLCHESNPRKSITKSVPSNYIRNSINNMSLIIWSRDDAEMMIKTI